MSLDTELIHFIIGLLGLFVWAYVLFCIFFRQILIDRILSRGRYWHIGVIFLMVAMVPFALSAVCQMCGIVNYDLLSSHYLYSKEDLAYFQETMGSNSESPSLVSAVLFQFRGFGSHFYAGTERGKAWSLVIGILGTILFSGLLIPSVLSIIRMRADNYTWGQARYRIQRSSYAVIIGAHEAVPELIHQILSPSRAKRIKYVIVQTIRPVQYYRIELQQHLSQREEFHTILYNGGRSTVKEMADLHLERAEEVYVLGEPQSVEWDVDHDSLGVQCIRHIASLLAKAKRSQRMQCYVLFEHPSTFTSFQFSDLSAVVKEQIEFISLNIDEMWAQRVLVQAGVRGQVQYQPLEGTACLDAQSDQHVHLVVVGFSRQGVAMAMTAAHVAHYPNFVTRGHRTRITIIDSAAGREKDAFMSRNQSLFDLCRWRYLNTDGGDTADSVAWHDPLADPAGPYAHLAQVPEGSDPNFLDVEFEFVQGRVESPAVRQYLREVATDPLSVLTVAICFRQEQQTMAAAVYLPSEVYRHAVQVLVYQRTSSDIVRNLAGMGQADDVQQRMRYGKMRPFGMLTDSFPGTIVDYRLAKLINYAYWRTDDTDMHHVDDIDPSTGLPNQESFWRQCSVADQWSSNYNANCVPVKLRFLGLDLETSPIEDIRAKLHDPALTDIVTRVEHNRWNIEKLLTGYRPVNAEEWADFTRQREPYQTADGKTDWKAMPYKEYARGKKGLRAGWEMAHLNICSMEDLERCDAPAIDYDLILSQAYPSIVRVWRSEA